MKEAVMKVVGEHFRPEFINRIDDTIVFHQLLKDQIRTIAALQIERLVKRLVEQNMMLKVDDNALNYLAEVGYDPFYGARPLKKRAIQVYFENPLAQDILSGKFLSGQVINVTRKGDSLSFTASQDEIVSVQ